jgi:glycosyltransferase involved in cell wall biosynthesis
VNITYIVTRADIGGVQIHLRDLTAALQAQGHSITVITGGNGPFVDSLRAQKTPTIIAQHLTVPIRPVQDIRALHELRAALKALRPDLVAAHSSKAGILGRLAARSLGIPAVLTAHGWNFSPGIGSIPAAVYRQIERSIGPITTRIITVSEFDRRLALEAGLVPATRIVTVHNGIPDIPRALRADPGRVPPRLVMVARFGAQKDHGTLLRALAGLQEHPWELDLVGDGPLMRPMQSLAIELGLGDRVHFLGQRLDVEQILASSQLSLLATNWEGLPLSILEAMRAGLPVVASAVGGIAEAVRDHETGYLVPRGAEQVLRDRIARLLTDSTLRIRFGDAGRRLYEEQFTLDRFVTNTFAVYRSMLAE